MVAVSATKDSGNSLNVFLINTTDFSLKPLTETRNSGFFTLLPGLRKVTSCFMN